MIDVPFIRHMARYNRWQNQNLYAVADGIGSDERCRERGAFFGSIHATFNHLLWADRMWMSRLAGTPKPTGSIRESVQLCAEWGDLKAARVDMDDAIIRWADALEAGWPKGDLTWYSGAAKREMSLPRWQVIVHFFNHQTHHRGQVHCLLTQAGGKPHDTDLMLMPDSAGI